MSKVFGTKWQPVMLFVRQEKQSRLECHECGALATVLSIVVGPTTAATDMVLIEDAYAWCQVCLTRANEQEETMAAAKEEEEGDDDGEGVLV